MGQSTMTFPCIVFLSAFLLGCSYSQSSVEDYSGSGEPQYGCGGENVPSTSSSGDYIAGGSVTAPNQYPWMVQINGGCGGSLISSRHVITAHHCYYEYDSTNDISTVKLGAHDQYNSSAYQEVEVEDVYFPPGKPLWKDIDEMNPDGCHDLAIVLLKEPVKFSATVQPVCLPSHDDLVHVGQEAMAMGWGETEDGDQSELLKHLDVEIYATKNYRGYCGDNFLLTGRKFASNGVLEGALIGDSGGPLVYKHWFMSDSWKIIGVLAGSSSTENIWNKVTAHLDWINGILAEQQTK